MQFWIVFHLLSNFRLLGSAGDPISQSEEFFFSCFIRLYTPPPPFAIPVIFCTWFVSGPWFSCRILSGFHAVSIFKFMIVHAIWLCSLFASHNRYSSKTANVKTVTQTLWSSLKLFAVRVSGAAQYVSSRRCYVRRKDSNEFALLLS